MKDLIQYSSIAIGLISTYYWWASAQSNAKIYDHLPESMGDGATAYLLGPNEYLVHDSAKQNGLNARAALLTGLALVLQLVATLVR